MTTISASGGADALQKLIGQSSAMQRAREQICRIARSPVPVLILGETGTGKELCAQAIAAVSGRRPFVTLNCAALPEGTVESELFGHERGAFTGAVKKYIGVIARADGGVLFLDELAELASPLQAKLLRTLESGEYTPMGSTETLRSEFRILAATSGDLDRLRPDLLYRLGATRVLMPPLRERLEDIPVLAEEFLLGYLERANAGPRRVSAEACALLMQQNWPGNLRQLRNVVEAAAAVATPEHEIGMLHVVQFLAPVAGEESTPDALPTLAEARARAELRVILAALGRSGGNRGRAAKLLRISEATLYRKLGKGRSQERESAP